MMTTLADLPREARIALKLTPPTTDDELWNWFAAVCDLRVPRVAVCDCHDSPFQWVADCYFDRVPRAIIMGPRGGGKTITAAALSYAELLHKPGVEIASVGAILDQAQKMYRYIRGWMMDDVELGIVYPPTMKSTMTVTRSRLEVITGRTVEAVNSPHPHRTNIDEYELFAPDVFEEALLMPTETAKFKSNVRLLSTRKYATGLVQQMIDEADMRGYKVYSFCGLDVAEKCTEEVRPTCDDCKLILKYDQHGQPVSWYDICQERLRNADGFYAIDELISKFRAIEHGKYATQVAPCTRPTRGDACFSEFDEDRHAPAFIDYDPRYSVGTTWDFGLHDPNVCLIIQWNTYGEAWVIDAIYSGELADTEEARHWLVGDVGAELLRRPYAGELLETRDDHWGDPAGRQKRVYTKVDSVSAFDVLRGMGIRVRGKKRPSPARRIEAIKLKLRPHPQTHEPSLYVSKRLTKVIAALTFAQWKEGREEYEHDEHSHILDALGYFIDAKWPPKSWTKGETGGKVACY